MALGILAALRTSRMQVLIDAMDAAVTGGKVKIYNGTRPATGGAATTLLATLTLSTTSATVTSGVLTFNSITNGTAVATSTATWARITDGDDNFVTDLDVTATGGGGDLELPSTTITSGGEVSISGGTLTAGNP